MRELFALISFSFPLVYDEQEMTREFLETFLNTFLNKMRPDFLCINLRLFLSLSAVAMIATITSRSHAKSTL